MVQMCCGSHSRHCWITHAQYHQLIGSQIGRVRKKQFSVQCTGDPKAVAITVRPAIKSIPPPKWLGDTLFIRGKYLGTTPAHCTRVQCISCSARAHHQFYFIQTQFVNVSSLTIITAQVFHKYSLLLLNIESYGLTSLTNPFGL